MDTDPGASFHDEYRLESQMDKVTSLWLQLKNFSQRELYEKIRQLEDWANTLESKEEKQLRRMQQLGLDISDSTGYQSSSGDVKSAEPKSSDEFPQVDPPISEKEVNDTEELKEFEPAAKRPAPAFQDVFAELKPAEENLTGVDEVLTKDKTRTQSPKAE